MKSQNSGENPSSKRLEDKIREETMRVYTRREEIMSDGTYLGRRKAVLVPWSRKSRP